MIIKQRLKIFADCLRGLTLIDNFYIFPDFFCRSFIYRLFEVFNIR